jgi:hypothetical protein
MVPVTTGTGLRFEASNIVPATDSNGLSGGSRSLAPGTRASNSLMYLNEESTNPMEEMGSETAAPVRRRMQ